MEIGPEVIEPLPFDGIQPEAPHGSFALTDDEREVLATWAEHARATGIACVEDLRQRAWPATAEDASIIGVFREGERLATWLVVGLTGSWAVASCTRGEVVGSAATLAEALKLIAPLTAD